MHYIHTLAGFVGSLVLIFPLYVGAQILAEPPARIGGETLPYYQYVSEVPRMQFSVPTQVELIVPDSYATELEDLVVYEEGTARFIQATLKKPVQTNYTPTVTISRNSGTQTTSLSDGDPNTFYTVEAYPDGVQRGDTWISTVSIAWQNPVQAQSAVFALDSTGPMPTQVMVTADGVTVVPWQPYSGELLSFSQSVDARRFQISFEHTSDVRITEASIPYTKEQEYTRLGFLMQPQETYRVYSSPVDKTGLQNYTRTSSYTQGGAQLIGTLTPTRNNLFWNADHDGDGLSATRDNCIQYANPNQEDLNNNGIGDACEDFDADNIPAAIDNCPNRPNANQRDTDGDGIGDECDPEESRLTEQYAWVPLVGIIIAGVVLMGLFASVTLAARKFKTEEKERKEEHITE